MSDNNKPVSRLCSFNADSVHYREHDLVNTLLDGRLDFVQIMAEHILGRRVTDAQGQVLHAVMIVLMEHGLSPGAIATRLVYMSAPEAMQSAVAAGLLAVGSQFVGTVENCALLLEEISTAPKQEQIKVAERIVARLHAGSQRVPGLGHHLHAPEDPRAQRLISLAGQLQMPGHHLHALRCLADAANDTSKRYLPVNATGAVAALLGEAQIPVRLMRGFAVVSRAAGLVAHVGEEQERPAGRYIWDTILDDLTPGRETDC